MVAMTNHRWVFYGHENPESDMKLQNVFYKPVNVLKNIKSFGKVMEINLIS